MMRRRALASILAASSLALMAQVAQAETVKHETELSLLGSYIEPDSDRTDEYGSAVRAMFGIRLGKHWWLEPQLYSGVMETGVNGGTDYYQQGLGADLSYRLWESDSFTPYGSLGGGVSRNDVANNPASEFGGYANAALGILSSPFTQSGLRVRADARYVYDSYDDGLSDLHFSLGVTVPIGATRTRIVEKTTVIEKPVVVEKDFADSDKDGVVDGVDQCPNTLEGLEVNSVGCVETDKAQSVVLQGVTFEFNSDRLTANARDILIPAADALKGQPDLKVELAGHTDSVGSEAYNQQLSQQRAEAVRDYLLDLGVDPDQLTAVGYGESRPIRSNDTEEGRERNRRVEFNVVSE
ncbi:OmpA family protein [Marinobacter pelagius]|uniref:OmpA family protein n=1 Tax=Marinobacter sp. C7 TaxID=2951363 RepID=UPI001EF0D6FA|nr:OmpA family protein [Marinobacter sp. C7]MCG7198950.1 OmpA family protein [Marinobacter sp. C7]